MRKVEAKGVGREDRLFRFEAMAIACGLEFNTPAGKET